MAVDQAQSAIALAQKQQIFDIAVLALDLLLRTKLMDFQVELLDELLDLAEETHNHWKKYRPYEIKLINDVKAIPIYEKQYGAVTAQFNAIAEDTFASNHDDYLDWLQDTCGPGQTVCEDIMWDTALGLQRVDLQAYGMRFEEFNRFAEDAIRFSRQKAVAGLGKDAALPALRAIDMLLQGPGNLGTALLPLLAQAFRPAEIPATAPPPPRPIAQPVLVPQRTITPNPPPVDNGVIDLDPAAYYNMDAWPTKTQQLSTDVKRPIGFAASDKSSQSGISNYKSTNIGFTTEK
jgi:hypothetical protein